MSTFREIFAGKARLSQVLSSSSRFMVGNPVEIKPNKHVGKSQDILDDACFKQLLADTKKPNQLWHFGLPCGSFSILQHSNGGTRRVTCPEGDGSLPREVLGNKLLERTLILIDSLEKHGNFWTLESPASSYAWRMPGLKERMSDGKHLIALLHQCACGLKLKDSEGKWGPCKKHTRFLGNLPTLPELSRMYHCHSKHVHAVEGVRTPEGWKRRSKLAGHYPYALCHKYATLAGRILPPWIYPRLVNRFGVIVFYNCLPCTLQLISSFSISAATPPLEPCDRRGCRLCPQQ